MAYENRNTLFRSKKKLKGLVGRPRKYVHRDEVAHSHVMPVRQNCSKLSTAFFSAKEAEEE